MTWARDRAYQCLSLKALVSKFYVKLKGSLRCHAAPPTYLWVVLLPPKILHVRWCVMRCDYGVIKKGETDDRTPHPAKPLEWSNQSYLCEWCVVRGSGGRRGLGLEERASKAPPHFEEARNSRSGTHVDWNPTQQPPLQRVVQLDFSKPSTSTSLNQQWRQKSTTDQPESDIRHSTKPSKVMIAWVITSVSEGHTINTKTGHFS